MQPLQGRDVQFSLNALLIPWDVSTSICYTPAELLCLAQSSFPQQRVLALRTLALLVTRVSNTKQMDMAGDSWFVSCFSG